MGHSEHYLPSPFSFMRLPPKLRGDLSAPHLQITKESPATPNNNDCSSHPAGPNLAFPNEVLDGSGVFPP